MYTDMAKCLKYHYYLKSIDECFSCKGLCQERESRGNSLTTCLTECPEYYQDFMLEVSSSTTAVALTEKTSGDTDKFLQIGLPCIIAAILLIAVIIWVINVLKRRKKRKAPIQETGTNEPLVESANSANDVNKEVQEDEDSGIVSRGSQTSNVESLNDSAHIV